MTDKTDETNKTTPWWKNKSLISYYKDPRNPDCEKWWIPFDIRAWPTIYCSFKSNIVVWSSFRFIFTDEIANQKIPMEQLAINSWLTTKPDERFSIAAVQFGERHMTYLLMDTTNHLLIHLNNWGSGTCELTEPFDQSIRKLSTKLSYHYFSSSDYWNHKTWNLNNHYPNGGLCMTIPHILVSLLVDYDTPIEQLCNVAFAIKKSALDSYFEFLALQNAILDILLDCFEPVFIPEDAYYTSKRRQFDYLYRTIFSFYGTRDIQVSLK